MMRSPIAATAVPGWDVRFPWLRAGTTRRVTGLAGAPVKARHPAAGHRHGPDGPGGPAGPAPGRSDPGVPGLAQMRLCASPGRWRSAVRSRQVHGSAVHVHVEPPGGVFVLEDGDGHVTASAGLLLTVTVADCVPVFIADPDARAVGLLHAGWRGTAMGILEAGIHAMASNFGSVATALAVHLGPAICGGCYEVGPEVFRSLGERPPPGPRPIDLRRVIRGRAGAAGVPDESVTVSRECTLCGDGRYYSHRRGDSCRQRAYVGIVPGGARDARTPGRPAEAGRRSHPS